MVSNSNTERLANPNPAFVTGTVNFCLDAITGHESSITHAFFQGFFWTSGLASWASDLFHFLAHCLVSKKVSVLHSSSYTDK